MRNSDQLNEGIGGRNLCSVGGAVQGVSNYGLASCRKPVFRPWTHQGADFVASLEQTADQRAAQVAGAAGDEHFVTGHVYALAASRLPNGRKYCVPLMGAETFRSNSCKSSFRSTKSISEVFTTRRSEDV